ncbi:MAG: MMPL family transporter [Clostridia bacterium]|nr:MMPL family transporter [Clostridia bacterium]
MLKTRYIALAIILAAAVVCGVLATTVPVNRDRTKYLSDKSNMKQGLSIMESEFPEAEEKSSVRVMFDGLDAEQISDVKARLEAIPNVSGVAYEAGSEDYNKGGRTLFVVASGFDYNTDEEKAIEAAIRDGFNEFTMSYRNDDIQSTEIPFWLIPTALALVVIILLVMSDSWLDPLLLLIPTAAAVAINMGTNIFLPYIDGVTYSVGPVLQLVLSMDYSIILLNRYRREREKTVSKTDAMKTALAGSMSSIASSSLTTVAGLLALVFLSFKLGPELGIVLAKGVFISMISVFAVLPALIPALDRQLEKAKKKSPHIPMGALSRFSHKARRIMPAIFAVLLIGFFFLQSFTTITFSEKSDDPLADVFPKENAVAVIYANGDEEKIPGIISELEGDEHVSGVNGYSNTLGRELTAEEMRGAVTALSGETQLDESVIPALYYAAGVERMPLPRLFDVLSDAAANDEQLAALLDGETGALIRALRAELTDAVRQLRGETYSRLVVTSDYPDESPETLAYIEKLDALCKSGLGEYYLVGDSVMISEMGDTFDNEYLMITLITALAVFLVVLIAFRNPTLPLILTLLVQCGVFITVSFIGAYSGSIYYLALLIVQSILMGATIDYGIVFCNFYREGRKTADVRGALKSAYEGSVHTVMTSGSILVLVLTALGIFASAPMISSVCITLAIGAFIAILLILFVLPGTVACCDRLIRGRSRSGKATAAGHNTADK